MESLEKVFGSHAAYERPRALTLDGHDPHATGTRLVCYGPYHATHVMYINPNQSRCLHTSTVLGRLLALCYWALRLVLRDYKIVCKRKAQLLPPIYVPPLGCSPCYPANNLCLPTSPFSAGQANDAIPRPTKGPPYAPCPSCRSGSIRVKGAARFQLISPWS